MNHEAKRINATVLMCDMRGFTALVDALDPVEAMTLATSVMSELGRVVEESGGVVDKFMGDGLLAHFGVEQGESSHALLACNCALRIKESEIRINAMRYSESLPVISMGIGLCTGPLAVGMIMTKHKVELSIFGDTVNMASRIENLTRLFQVDILISSETAAQVEGHFELRAMPPAKLRGKLGEYVSHWLLPVNTPATS
ncbi:MAG: adenylate/guanylate cyclase domain-containing protein [Bdellovibrionota bacterium]